VGDGLTRTIPLAVATAVTDGGATETVVLVSNPITTSGPGQTVTLVGEVNITAGTNGVAAVIKIRRGSTTSGAQVGPTLTTTEVATKLYTIPLEITDAPGDVGGLTYCVTVAETSASANGTVNYAAIGGYYQ